MHSNWKSQFPALVNSTTAYFDSASSCQIPQEVIDKISEYMRSGHGNPHRGMYPFSEKAENIQQRCREKIAQFIQCKASQIAFTKGTTESINLVANSLMNQLDSSHSILVTQMEHHANLLPWQRLCANTGARLNVLPMTKEGELDECELDALLADKCALFAFTHCSNVLGTVNPVSKLVARASIYGVPTLVDGAQAVAHFAVDMQTLDCDYYAFSGHKLYAPGGIGVLYCKQPNALQPLLLGGGIVSRVTEQDFQLLDDIARFEAGSANMPGIVGLDAAIDFINAIGFKAIAEQEAKLRAPIISALNSLNIWKLSHKKSQSIISFSSSQFHSHDIASILADENVAVRAGHHCAQPCLNALGIKQCVRISLGLYNDSSDVEQLISALNKVKVVLE